METEATSLFQIVWGAFVSIAFIVGSVWLIGAVLYLDPAWLWNTRDED